MSWFLPKFMESLRKDLRNPPDSSLSTDSHSGTSGNMTAFSGKCFDGFAFKIRKVKYFDFKRPGIGVDVYRKLNRCPTYHTFYTAPLYRLLSDPNLPASMANEEKQNLQRKSSNCPAANLFYPNRLRTRTDDGWKPSENLRNDLRDVSASRIAPAVILFVVIVPPHSVSFYQFLSSKLCEMVFGKRPSYHLACGREDDGTKLLQSNTGVGVDAGVNRSEWGRRFAGSKGQGTFSEGSVLDRNAESPEEPNSENWNFDLNLGNAEFDREWYDLSDSLACDIDVMATPGIKSGIPKNEPAALSHLQSPFSRNAFFRTDIYKVINSDNETTGSTDESKLREKDRHKSFDACFLNL